ncbi:MAG: hypothetical protein ABIG44_17850 [Planctomycetota bacterium]
MPRAPNWTEAEFELVVEDPERSDADIATELTSRSAGAVNVVRNGIHSYHLDRDISMLSEMMQRRLADRTRPVRCPRCGVRV